MKKLALLILIFASAVYVLLYHSSEVTRYECIGSLVFHETQDSKEWTLPGSRYIKLERFRPWVTWADSVGSLYWEWPYVQVGVISHIEGDELLRLHKRKGEEIEGTFSTVSNHLQLRNDDISEFRSRCVRLN